MKRRFLWVLWCAVSTLSILPVCAESDSTSAPVADTAGSPLVDAAAMLLAAAILCGVIFLFYRVLHPKTNKEEQPQNRRLKRR